MRARAVLSLLSVPAACLLLAGCVMPTVFPLSVGFGADVAVFHRTLPDMAYSAITGKDCSAVRLDRGESYCKPVAPPVPPQPYCTRTLAQVMCWADPTATPGIPSQVAQGPSSLTPEQNRLRLARWPTALQ
ncbi:hypothetical protein NFI95_13260 [Acetobacteraceae bacterium KSS8]|uniref:Lipoprotein n=1 Tax=Endosaccharibacter trunci TaxID=2812733 RepID=A0ABT1WC65_9PROT|nr:hypothetical protein [Acetobacteraceae bacterium KSS8]